MRKLLISALAAAAIAAAPAVAQEKYNLTLAGASPGGLWSAIGAALDKVYAKAYPGSTITYQTGSGGLANAKLVQDKKVPFGIIADMELAAAYRGQGAFKGKPQKDLRTLFRVYAPGSRFQYTYVLLNGDVAKKFNITDMDSLKKNARQIRIAFNRPGNMDGDIGIAVVTANGIPLKSFKQVIRAASSELTSLMLDRRVDAVSFGVSYNHARIREMEKGIPLAQISVGAAAATDVANQYGGQPCTIKANEHKFINQDMISVCVGGIIAVHKDMPEKQAYDLVKGVLKEIETFKAAHRALKAATTPQSLAESAVAPHHPGAIKAFKEAGLL